MDGLPLRLGKFLADYANLSKKEVKTSLHAVPRRVLVFQPTDDRPSPPRDHASNPDPAPPLHFAEAKEANEGTLIYEDDAVYVDGRQVQAISPAKRYFMFHKPEGFMTVMGKQVYGEKLGLAQFMQDLPPGVVPVGRLDKLTTAHDYSCI